MLVVIEFMTTSGTELIQPIGADFIEFVITFKGFDTFFGRLAFHFWSAAGHIRFRAFVMHFIFVVTAIFAIVIITFPVGILFVGLHYLLPPYF
jgi:hypothetical protein